LLRDFGREEFLRKNIPAVAHIHAPHDYAPSSRHANDNDEHAEEEPEAHNGNWHAHIKAGTRTLGADGQFSAKKYVTWDNYHQQLDHWREKWAELGARYLEKAGHKIEAERWRYGHLTNPEQMKKALERGDHEWAERKAREASKHRGPQVDAMEKRGVETDRGNIYRDMEDRADLPALKAELAELEKQVSIEYEAQREIQWQDAIARAAIEKEARQEQFLEKLGGAEREILLSTREAREYAELAFEVGKILTERGTLAEPAPAEPERGTLPAPVREPQQREAAEDNLSRLAAEIWAAYNHSPTPEAFAAKLEEKRMRLSAPTKEEAAAADYRQGEIVVVSEPRLEYRREGQIEEPRRVFRLNQRTTGDDWRAVEKFFGGMDRSPLQGIEATKEALAEQQKQRREEIAAARMEWADRSANENIRPAALADKATRAVGDALAAGTTAARTVDKGVGAAMKLTDAVANTLGGILTFLIPDPPKTRAEIKAMERDAERAEAGERRAAYDREHDRFVESREEERRRRDDRER
jgi:hypothetical protein